MPWNLSGMGRRLLVSRRILVALIDSSPVLVFISVPSAPMMSPRSHFLKSSYTASPTVSRVMYSWMRPVASCTVAKLALPITRLSIMRPPTLTVTGLACSASVSSALYCAARAAARCWGLKSLGKAATPWAWACSRMVFSFSRRSAMSLFSSWGGGSRIGQRQISGVRHGSKRAARGQG